MVILIRWLLIWESKQLDASFSWTLTILSVSQQNMPWATPHSAQCSKSCEWCCASCRDRNFSLRSVCSIVYLLILLKQEVFSNWSWKGNGFSNLRKVFKNFMTVVYISLFRQVLSHHEVTSKSVYQKFWIIATLRFFKLWKGAEEFVFSSSSFKDAIVSTER